MDTQKVDMYILSNSKYFPAEKVPYIREKLLALPDDKYILLTSLEMKDPTTILLISIFLGTLGIDRFMIGDTGMGVLKLLTGGCCGILAIVDWFTISGKTKELNFNKIMSFI